MRGVLVLCLLALVKSDIDCQLDTVIGCYSDFEDGKRLLLYEASAGDDQMTQNKCAQLCFLNSYILSGVEDGIQCFCGNSFNPDASPTVENMSECQLPCGGNSSQPCGDAFRMLVFTAKCTNSQPNYQACLTPLAQSFQYCNTSLSFDDRVDDLLSHLSLDQKIATIGPDPNLGNPCATHTDGADSIGLGPWMWLVETNTGVASACVAQGICASTFPGPVGLGATFNTSVWFNKGSVFGSEMRAFANFGWHRGDGGLIGLTGFGPNINIARDPRFGRNSELPGEDPFLSGKVAAAMVRGMQTPDSHGYPKMLAFLKHFTAYSRETNRGHDTYNISMHDLWDTYLAQYEIAFLEGQPSGVMCSYNGINGHPSCANGYILNDVLRGMWNKDAIVTTDCGAVSNLRQAPIYAPTDAAAAAMALNNGSDIEMGSTLFTYSLKTAVQQNLTTEAAVTAAARRAFLGHFRLGRFDPFNSSDWSNLWLSDINSDEHKDIVMDAALQSFVLLKNDNNLLPLKRGVRVAVLGPQGVARYGLLSDYYGDEVCYGGNFDCIPTIAESVTAENVGGVTLYTAGVSISGNDTSDLQKALDLVSFVDVVILAMGIDKTIEQEGVDRTDTRLPGIQEPFAELVMGMGKPTVLVLVNGGALAIDNLISGATAIVEAFNPSVTGSRALAKTLFGSNRWGKLPITMYPHDYINKQPMSNYDMSVYPGRTYRYYQDAPLFPFGFGLSYSPFSHTCDQLSALSYSCVIYNLGDYDGDEVLMVFHSVGNDIRAKANHPIPIKALVDFQRVSTFAHNPSNPVQFNLSSNVFAVVNKDGKKVVYPGSHSLTFSRGHGLDVTFKLTMGRNANALVPE
eukprot:c2962_g1_i1.p1 GENE.c2962_g1_i1~~c2962_g1_i1.p1  ORF type:complete len:853 (-),score=180.57 c2962_g1_i1:68-2626(-)